MVKDTPVTTVSQMVDEIVPPPHRGRQARCLCIHAVQLVQLLSLLPLVARVIGFAIGSHRKLPRRSRSRTGRPMGRPRVYSEASILLVALIGRVWHLSYNDVCLWLCRWPALAAACGFRDDRVIHSAHLGRRVRQLGAYPFWLLFVALVWRAIRSGLIRGRDVVIDSTLLAAWSRSDLDAAWSYPSRWKGRIFGYKVHTIIDRYARLPIGFVLSSANRNDLPFAYPLLWLARFFFALPVHVVRADGAYWGLGLVRYIVTVIKARPIIPFNRKKQPIHRVRHLVWYRLSYAARSIIERFFAAAKRYYRLDTSYVTDWDAVLIRTCLTFCSILTVALAAHESGAPELRLSPTRVLAHYQPISRLA